MKSKTTILAIFIAWAFFHPGTKAQDMAVVNVSVIDCTGSKEKPNMTVLVTDGKITAIEKFFRKNFGANTRIIDGKGKYLIPGLWDMHVHCLNDSLVFFPLMICNGITSVRDMYNNAALFEMKTEWRKLINEGKLIGPNMYIPLAVFGPDQNWWWGIVVKSKEEAANFVREAKASGADFIKIYDLYDPEVYFSIVNEAKQAGIRVVGHCPISVNIADAADAGQSTFEHLLGILIASSSKEAQIRSQMVQKTHEVHDSFSDLTRLLFYVQSADISGTYDVNKANNLFRRLKNSGSYQCPTLVFWKRLLTAINTDTCADGRFKNVPAKDLKYWYDLKADLSTAKISKEDFNLIRTLVKMDFQLVKELNRRGVKLLAGTDITWYKGKVMPKFGLHDELSLLVEAGLSPMEALLTATKNAAEALGVLDKTGTLEVGKCADMVLLDANPLKDIQNTTKINSVVKAGNYYSRDKLDNLLHDVEMKAKK